MASALGLVRLISVRLDICLRPRVTERQRRSNGVASGGFGGGKPFTLTLHQTIHPKPPDIVAKRGKVNGLVLVTQPETLR